MHFHVHVIPRYEGGPKIAAWDPGAVSVEETKEIIEAVTTRL
jgi:histidine triad (HIT) family protein